ncbi:hypothetical protein P4S72_08850 [Vibrio sp. PP-XX7]
MSLLRVSHLAVKFKQRHSDLDALLDVSFSIQPGERVAIVGESVPVNHCWGMPLLTCWLLRGISPVGRFAFVIRS